MIDPEWPANPVKGTLTINVDRNPTGPEFSQKLYTKTLRGNHLVGDSVIQLLAPDTDGVRLIVPQLLFTCGKVMTPRTLIFVIPTTCKVCGWINSIRCVHPPFLPLHREESSLLPYSSYTTE